MQIAMLINACDKCQNLRPSLKAKPLQQLPAPKEPMQTVSTDLYELKRIQYGLVEAAVKSIKYLLIKSDTFADFKSRLYKMQAVPSSGKTNSPAELFYNLSNRPFSLHFQNRESNKEISGIRGTTTLLERNF
jgi:hypothetical protein